MQSYVNKIGNVGNERTYGSQGSNAQKTSSLLREIGTVLREAREKKSYSIRNIKEITCIPTHHIIAIESGDRAKLPEDLYLIGFIKQFARAVNTDERIIMEMISRERKYKSAGYESDAFDLLFNENKVKRDEQEQKK